MVRVSRKFEKELDKIRIENGITRPEATDLILTLYRKQKHKNNKDFEFNLFK
jgi:hypothetical protein